MQGTLFLIVGPSGAGKDTLIAAARAALDEQFAFARRVITRAAEPDGEGHACVDVATFESLERAGAFALSWRAHGLAYGIPASIADDLKRGQHVVANVSRSVVADARARFARVHVIMVTAPADALRLRLEARGREARDAIAGRLHREVAVAADVTIVNDGAPEAAIQAFVAALKR